MTNRLCECDVLIIGAGPAGLAAACRASESRKRVLVVDDNPDAGGQIWRKDRKKPPSKEAAVWFDRIRNSKIELINGARVFHQLAPRTLLAETSDSVLTLASESLILATGARERFLPFPGWTLPNVMGAGGLQALVKGGLDINGKRVVVAGSGPLLVAVAAYLRERGAQVLLIAEQASARSLATFGLTLARESTKVSETIRLRRLLKGVKYLSGCWPIAAHGHHELSGITLRRGKETWTVACDFLACGFHLLPNLELAELLGCSIENGVVIVDEFQKTSLKGVFAAGEATGVGGLELSIIEGEIAGLTASGRNHEARNLFAKRRRHQSFSKSLNRTFLLRDELKQLAEPDTIVCRCEDVTFDRLRGYESWRAAKLHTRCGMGPCQGRICGGALEFLFGWRAESVRPPIFPVRLANLISRE